LVAEVDIKEEEKEGEENTTKNKQKRFDNWLLLNENNGTVSF